MIPHGGRHKPKFPGAELPGRIRSASSPSSAPRRKVPAHVILLIIHDLRVAYVIKSQSLLHLGTCPGRRHLALRHLSPWRNRLEMIFLGSQFLLPQHFRAILVDGFGSRRLRDIPNIPQVLCSGAVSPFRNHAAWGARSTMMVEPGPHVFACEFSVFSG